MPIEKPIQIQKIYYQKNFLVLHILRALNLIESNPGISLGELIYKLKITKQSINRVIRDLLKSKMIKQLKDDADTRKKNYILIKMERYFLRLYIKNKKKNIQCFEKF